MTLHVNTTNIVSQKILKFLESLSIKGEKIEIIDDSIYQFEKKQILNSLEQIKNGEVYSSGEIIDELSK